MPILRSVVMTFVESSQSIYKLHESNTLNRKTIK